VRSQWCFAEIAIARALGKERLPIRLDNTPLPPFLADRQAADLAADLEPGYRNILRDLRQLVPEHYDLDWDPGRPPYPGLMAFEKEDAAVYFGRDQEISLGIESLGRLRQLGGARLLVILGASGTGKSSLVRAGIVPRLARNPMAWLVVNPFRPLETPLAEFDKRLANLGATGPVISVDHEKCEPDKLAEQFLQKLANLQRHRRQEHSTVLLVIDQLEELYTYVRRSNQNASVQFFGTCYSLNVAAYSASLPCARTL